MNVLDAVCEVFGGTDLPWGLFGSAAIACYAPERFFSDIDVLTLESALPEVARGLGVPVSRDPYNQPIVYFENCEIYGRMDIATPVGICTFRLDEAMIARRERLMLAGQPVMVLAREDHIVLKAILQRGVDSGKLDTADILTLSRLAPLNAAYLRQRIEQCRAVGWADVLLARMGVVDSV
jgi:predicted nucleotidyltransferase